jgi:hypothetical protein
MSLKEDAMMDVVDWIVLSCRKTNSSFPRFSSFDFWLLAFAGGVVVVPGGDFKRLFPMLILARLIGQLHQQSIVKFGFVARESSYQQTWSQDNKTKLLLLTVLVNTMLLSVGQSVNTDRWEYANALTACN